MLLPLDSAIAFSPCSSHLTTLQRHIQRCDQVQLFEQLATILLEFYYCTGSASLLDAVVELCQARMRLVVICDASQTPAARAQVADALFAAYELNCDLDALEQSIVFYQHILDRCPALSPSQRSYLEARLGYALLHRYRARDDEGDYHAALRLTKRARRNGVDRISRAWVRTVEGHVNSTTSAWSFVEVESQCLLSLLHELRSCRKWPLPRSLWLLSLTAESQLAMAILTRTQRVGYIEPLIETMRLALQSCIGSSNTLRYDVLLTLSDLHFDAHYHAEDKLRTTAHLDAAVKYATAAQSLIELMGRNSYKRWDSLHQWALCSMYRAIHGEDLDAMEQAVDGLKQAVLRPPEGLIYRKYHGRMVAHLALVMVLYFEQTGRIGILDELFSLMKKYVTPDVLQTPFFASNIAEAMLSRAQVADAMSAKSLVNEAIQVCLARKGSSAFAKINGRERTSVDLQLIAASRMQIRAGVWPCVEAQDILQLAKLHPETQPPPQATSARAVLVVAQIDALIMQSRTEDQVAPLINGLALIEQELASPGMSSSIYVADLVAARADLLFAHSQVEDGDKLGLLQRAWEQYQYSTDSTSGRPRERFQICLRWASRAAEQQDISMACKAYSRAIDILPNVVFLGEDVIGRLEALRQVNGLAASSVNAALTIHNIPLAIECLERTRGIIWLQSFQPHDDDLLLLPSQIRNRFVDIAGKLGDDDNLHWTARRHKAEELGKLIADIRTYPGLERFQLPPLLQDVQLALHAKRANAVIINPSTLHCDVIILGMGSPGSAACHLRLQTLNLERIRNLTQYLNASCSVTPGGRNGFDVCRGILKSAIPYQADTDLVIPLLAELWMALVRPIIKFMNVQRASDPSCRKHLWWCPTGPLCSLPLHAAGIYEGPSQDHVGNYVLSSYTPTMTALFRLITRGHVQTASNLSESLVPKMLIVAQPTCVGLPPLANVNIEVDQIQAAVPLECRADAEASREVSVGEALNSLKHAHILHLACHGHQDQQNPLNSGFDLKDGRLTIAQLMRSSIPHAQLAYLSACDSAGIDESRPDEGLNLVGTMIFVGFKSVVGTMWAMDDLDGPFMAKHIYSRIFRDGTLNMGEVAYALDDAVRQLRETGVPASRWATYVHFGM